MKCPNCNTDLIKVCYPSDSMLNRDQWESQRAGDYYCPNCPDNGRGKSGHCYFWNKEIPSLAKCEYCGAYDGERHLSFCNPDYRQARQFETRLSACKRELEVARKVIEAARRTLGQGHLKQDYQDYIEALAAYDKAKEG